ncbi:MAG: glycosyltransferase family 2 protein [Chitinophagales bacterium]|nr:glycosyltransferase [Chitinophagales bacterium]MDW8394256.1 glycosyltransferase family 2 protein [Chitinophagales bacterium]
MPQLSVVVPLYNEAASLAELCQWIRRVCEQNHLSYEIILVDDGSTDESWSVIRQLAQQDAQIRGIRFRRNYGKSAALQEGFRAAGGEVVVTLDADLQDSPDELPVLYRRICQEGWDIISGWKRKRKDPISKTLPSRLFNKVTRWVSGIPLHDFNCGLKAYRSEVVKNIEVYGEMHRYIPVIAKWAGFSRIGEQEVTHYPRRYGSSKFGWSRFINGFLDLLSIHFITRFGRRPMHLFGTLGLMAFFVGFVIALWLGIQKFVFLQYKMTERPIFYVALAAMVIGVQLFVAGFLAELITRHFADRHNYQIAERIRPLEPKG